jgi:hypothetical protein
MQESNIHNGEASVGPMRLSDGDDMGSHHNATSANQTPELSLPNYVPNTDVPLSDELLEGLHPSEA